MQGEKELIKEKGIKVYTMHEMDRIGMTKVIEETIEYLEGRTNQVHLSLDLDGLDPTDAPESERKLWEAFLIGKVI